MIRGGQARLVEIDIERVVYGGEGLARDHGQVVFVPRGLPGERLRALVVQQGKGFARARPVEWIIAHPRRRPSPCSYFPRCGGCAHQDAEYSLQLAMKAEILRESLRRAGVAIDVETTIVPSPERGWRARARFHVDHRFGPPRLGLFGAGSRRVVDVAHCPQLSPALNRAVTELRELLSSRLRLAAAVEDVELAESYDGSARVAVLRLRSAHATVESLEPAHDSVLSGLGLAAAASGGTRFTLLSGSPFVDVGVGEIRLRAHAQSFFQANRFVVPALVEHVVELVGRNETVADLYAGVGLFATAVASRSRSVVAVESAPAALADARANEERLGLDNLNVCRSDVESFVSTGRAKEATVVVLDPPRTGVGRGVIGGLANGTARRLVYVSCDPPTLGRDVRSALGHGFSLTSLRAFDMFPDTTHVEAVAVLDR